MKSNPFLFRPGISFTLSYVSRPSSLFLRLSCRDTASRVFLFFNLCLKNNITIGQVVGLSKRTREQLTGEK